MVKFEPEQRQETGRMGFREQWEPGDGREYVINRSQFWQDEAEQLTYEHAAEANPRLPGEGPFTYIERLAGIAVGSLERMKSMPGPRRMSQNQHQHRLNELQSQAEQISREPGAEG